MSQFLLAINLPCVDKEYITVRAHILNSEINKNFPFFMQYGNGHKCGIEWRFDASVFEIELCEI